MSTRRIPDARLDVLESHYKALARDAMTTAAWDHYRELAALASEVKRLREENARLREAVREQADALQAICDRNSFIGEKARANLADGE